MEPEQYKAQERLQVTGGVGGERVRHTHPDEFKEGGGHYANTERPPEMVMVRGCECE